jgi:hypothetical protein
LFSLNQLWDFLGKYEYLFGVFFIVGGLLLSLFGRRLIKVAVFLLTQLIVTFIILILAYSWFFNKDTEEWLFWTILGVSIVAGIIAGYFMLKSLYVGVSIIGAWGGISLGLILYELL